MLYTAAHFIILAQFMHAQDQAQVFQASQGTVSELCSLWSNKLDFGIKRTLVQNVPDILVVVQH